jgi:hypothetical protein
VRRVALALALSALAVGCGGTTRSRPAATATSTTRARAPRRRVEPVKLHASGGLSLPSARSGVAAATFHGRLVVIGGLSAAGTSTPTVITVSSGGQTATDPPLPSPVHDAAAAALGGRLLLFGGGEFEGSDRIIQVAPGAPRQIGSLPQALSDLEAVTIGRRVYVLGGWNGSATNRDIYAVGPSGQPTIAGRIPMGVRYAAAAGIGGRVLIAGGELASGAPTSAAYAFDSRSGRTTPIPSLPAPIDHAAGAAVGDVFYVIGGLRRGALTGTILAWRPGQTRWRSAGRLARPAADGAATSLDGRILLAGGRDQAGKRTTVTVLSR